MKYLFLILSILILASCGKKTQIKVTAKNAATGEGYAGLGFQLIEIKPYTSSTGEIQNLVYEGTLNQQGEAVFEYRLKNRSYLITTLVPEEELCYINNTKYSLHRDDEDLTFDFRFAPCAYLKLKIENVNCEGPDDNFKLYHEGSDVGYLELGDNPVKEGDGCYSFEPSYFSDVPIGRRFYKWEVTRSGTTEVYYDTIDLQQNEYRTYEINY